MRIEFGQDPMNATIVLFTKLTSIQSKVDHVQLIHGVIWAGATAAYNSHPLNDSILYS